jgi:hypothetical protein
MDLQSRLYWWLEAILVGGRANGAAAAALTAAAAQFALGQLEVGLDHHLD